MVLMTRSPVSARCDGLVAIYFYVVSKSNRDPAVGRAPKDT